jgi:diguanylate cyclase (GGDEF)-like protein
MPVFSRNAAISGGIEFAPSPSMSSGPGEERVTPRTYDVLLVEDDVGLASGLRETLATAPGPGFRVTHVTRLADALVSVDEHRFDVVLLDLNLPDARGAVAPRTLQKAASDVPIVILTGVDDDQLAEENARAGVQDYLVKSEVNGDILVRSLRYAMERSRLLAEARALSIRDELTGLYNRRGFLGAAEQQLKTAGRLNEPVLLLFADVDGMKECNDAYGHAQGDRLLRQAARTLGRTFRESDILARLGGDEFAILSLASGLEDSRAIVERLQRNIDEENASGAHPVPLSMSVGLAYSDPASVTRLDDLMAQADAWMYGHKKKKKVAQAT